MGVNLPGDPPPKATSARNPRADAQRNRERLIAVAKTEFARVGTDVTLEEIARRAQVGIGTLYRHFPTRDAIVEAVYRREVEQLSQAAPRLLETATPAEALRQWLRLLVDYVATKKLMASALGSLAGGPSSLFAVSGTRITDALTALIQAAVATGEIRADVEPIDLMRAMWGFASGGEGWQASALRLIDILMDGLVADRSRP